VTDSLRTRRDKCGVNWPLGLSPVPSGLGQQDLGMNSHSYVAMVDSNVSRQRTPASVHERLRNRVQKAVWRGRRYTTKILAPRLPVTVCNSSARRHIDAASHLSVASNVFGSALLSSSPRS